MADAHLSLPYRRGDGLKLPLAALNKLVILTAQRRLEFHRHLFRSDLEFYAWNGHVQYGFDAGTFHY
jgi:hypothetical protein